MTTTLPAAAPAGPAARIPLRTRLAGLGSLYGKAIRDSRRAFGIELALLGALPAALLSAVAHAYPTQAARDELVGIAAATVGTAGQGFAGDPVNVGTPGGWVQWKYGLVFLLVAAFWSIFALTGTLSGEARRGSLDLVAAVPRGRRRIAIEKVGAHLTLLTLVALALALSTWQGSATSVTLPGDAVPLRGAVGFALWTELMSLAFGGLALTLAQFLGRAAACWIAGTVAVLGPILDNYRATVPGFGPIADLTPAAWTAHHLPLAGRYDWASLVLVALTAAALVAAGVETFARRDLGATRRLRLPQLPAPVLGLRGVTGRSLAERAPAALGWGSALGVFGLAMAAITPALADRMAASPDLAATMHSAFPDVDLTSTGGFLQLFIQLLFIAAGFAAVVLVAGWAGDETSGRLELVLASPLSRRSWAVRGCLGVLVAIALFTAVVAGGIGAGAALAGSDPGTPMAGTLVLGLFAAALAGIGFAVGGLVRPSAAAQTVATLVVATYLVDLFAPPLRLPQWVHQLALTAHLGRPMAGSWDVSGVLICLGLAAGGLALGSFGLARRDLGR